jgi:hypothetical protein
MRHLFAYKSHSKPYGGENMFALTRLSEEMPNTSLAWLLYIVLAFFLLMVIVGWLVSRTKQDQPEEKKPVKKVADNLAKIAGIRPKDVRVLKDIGITTYDELAHAKAGRIQKALDEAGLQKTNPNGWIAHAKLAAQGDWKGFEKLQSRSKSGRKVR